MYKCHYKRRLTHSVFFFLITKKKPETKKKKEQTKKNLVMRYLYICPLTTRCHLNKYKNRVFLEGCVGGRGVGRLEERSPRALPSGNRI